MQEIICPSCGKAFKIDESVYADILKQVRDGEFEKQLHERLELAEIDKRNAVELARAKVATELQSATAEKDAEIQRLKSELDAGDVAKRLAVSEAQRALVRERDALVNEIDRIKQDKEAASALAEATLMSELHKASSTKDAEIHSLKAKLRRPPAFSSGTIWSPGLL